MAEFLSPLDVRFIDGHDWEVRAPFEYHLGHDDGDECVSIPAGFVTDFASIPRGLWNVLPPTGPYGKAAVVHDWLYQRRRIVNHRTGLARLVERGEADRILNEGMAVLGVGRFTRWMVYSGVRMGGWKPWGHYRAQERHDDVDPRA